MNLVEGSPAAYEAIRQWEIDLMVKLRMTESDYIEMPLRERARKVCGSRLPEWVGVLESHRHYEEAKAKRG